MNIPQLSRRRYIPFETVKLRDDEILEFNDEIILTKWRTIKARSDFVRGYSCYFLKKGFKLSKYIDNDGNSRFIYCDIIETVYSQDKNDYVFNDLLIDVLVYNDGFVKVLDLDEVGEALETGLITLGQAKTALSLTNELLNIIYSGHFEELACHIRDLN